MQFIIAIMCDDCSFTGSVAPLPTEAQKIQASPGPMVGWRYI